MKLSNVWKQQSNILFSKYLSKLAILCIVFLVLITIYFQYSEKFAMMVKLAVNLFNSEAREKHYFSLASLLNKLTAEKFLTVIRDTLILKLILNFIHLYSVCYIYYLKILFVCF